MHALLTALALAASPSPVAASTSSTVIETLAGSYTVTDISVDETGSYVDILIPTAKLFDVTLGSLDEVEVFIEVTAIDPDGFVTYTNNSHLGSCFASGRVSHVIDVDNRGPGEETSFTVEFIWDGGDAEIDSGISWGVPFDATNPLPNTSVTVPAAAAWACPDSWTPLVGGGGFDSYVSADGDLFSRWKSDNGDAFERVRIYVDHSAVQFDTNAVGCFVWGNTTIDADYEFAVVLTYTYTP